MADYRDHYPQIQSAHASVAAVSADPPAVSERMRVQLSLPFPILSDTDRRIIQDWDIYNSRERGGIAKPAVFVLDPNRVVLYASLDTMAHRVPAAQIVSFLQTHTPHLRRQLHLPHFSDWLSAIRNNLPR